MAKDLAARTGIGSTLLGRPARQANTSTRPIWVMNTRSARKGEARMNRHRTRGSPGGPRSRVSARRLGGDGRPRRRERHANDRGWRARARAVRRVADVTQLVGMLARALDAGRSCERASGRERERRQACERGCELTRPGPAPGRGQGPAPRRAGEPPVEREVAPPQRLRPHDVRAQPEPRHPAREVVRDHLHREPSRVGGEAARGNSSGRSPGLSGNAPR